MYKALIIIVIGLLLLAFIVLGPKANAPSDTPAGNDLPDATIRDKASDAGVQQCLADFPQSDFSDCVPGQVQDGWTEKALYPNTTDTTGLDQQADMFISDQVKEASVAIYGNSASTCKTSWMIRNNGELEEVSQQEFCDFVVDQNNKCGNCLLVWQGGCC